MKRVKLRSLSTQLARVKRTLIREIDAALAMYPNVPRVLLLTTMRVSPADTAIDIAAHLSMVLAAQEKARKTARTPVGRIRSFFSRLARRIRGRK